MRWLESGRGVAVATWASLVVSILALIGAVFFFLLPWKQQQQEARMQWASQIYPVFRSEANKYEVSVENGADGPVFNARVIATAEGSPASLSYKAAIIRGKGKAATEVKVNQETALTSALRKQGVTLGLEFQDFAGRWWHRSYRLTVDELVVVNDLTEGRAPSSYWG